MIPEQGGKSHMAVRAAFCFVLQPCWVDLGAALGRERGDDSGRPLCRIRLRNPIQPEVIASFAQLFKGRRCKAVGMSAAKLLCIVYFARSVAEVPFK